MRACSEDLRKKIVVAVERGMPKAQAARLFDVSLPSVKLLEDRPSGRPPRAQEESRAAPQGERKYPGAPGGGREGAPGRHRLSKTPLFGTHNRQEP